MTRKKKKKNRPTLPRGLGKGNPFSASGEGEKTSDNTPARKISLNFPIQSPDLKKKKKTYEEENKAIYFFVEGEETRMLSYVMDNRQRKSPGLKPRGLYWPRENRASAEEEKKSILFFGCKRKQKTDFSYWKRGEGGRSRG